MNRFRVLLLFFGLPAAEAAKAQVRQVCRTFAEFALEYRTAREKVQQQADKKLQALARRKTRGKLIVDVSRLQASMRNQEEQVLNKDSRGVTGGSSRVRQMREGQSQSSSNLTATPKNRIGSAVMDDSEDLLEACLRSAVSSGSVSGSRRSAPRDRHRSTQRDRKSLRRTLKNGILDEDMPNGLSLTIS